MQDGVRTRYKVVLIVQDVINVCKWTSGGLCRCVSVKKSDLRMKIIMSMQRVRACDVRNICKRGGGPGLCEVWSFAHGVRVETLDKRRVDERCRAQVAVARLRNGRVTLSKTLRSAPV